MKLVMSIDPIEELEELLKEAAKNPDKVKHIELSRVEMRAIVSHKRAKEVIPDYYMPQNERLQRCYEKMQRLRTNQQDDYHRIPQQQFFDEMTKLEAEEAQILEVVPKQFVQNGITIFTSIQA